MSRTKHNRATTPRQFDFDFKALKEALDCLLFEFTTAITALKKKISGNFSLICETEKAKKEKGHAHPRRIIPPKYIKLSGLFLHYQQRNWPQYLKEITEKQILQGATQLERLVRIDGFEFNQVKDTLHWLTRHPDHFWCRNLRTLLSVRKECSDGVIKFAHILSAYDEADKEAGVEEEIRAGQRRYYRNLPNAVKDKFKYSGGARKLMELFESYCERIGIHEPSPKAIRVDGKLWRGFIREKERRLGISFKTGRAK